MVTMSPLEFRLVSVFCIHSIWSLLNLMNRTIDIVEIKKIELNSIIFLIPLIYTKSIKST